jgi:ADP-ribose pyrophosphatase
MAQSRTGQSRTLARTLSSKLSYRGPVFHITTDEVLEPGGVRARRDVIHHSGSVVVMPVDDTGREPLVLLERQYRHAANGYLWELPAGRIDPGEKELAAAKRELIEETGYRASRWKRILNFYASPGFLGETMSIYMATGLTDGEAQPEEDERIVTKMFTLSTLVDKILSGQIRDGKTIAGILWLHTARLAAQRRRPA